MIDYNKVEVIKSKRRTLAVQIKPGGRIIVRAPYFTGTTAIKRFLAEHETWIEKHLAKQAEAEAKMPTERLSMEEINELADMAMRIIPAKVAYYAKELGVTYGRITIRNQVTRWGSCSAEGNLNFNCLLMLAPDEVVDSVVVHELCHRLEMNHSKAFYAHVLSVFPEYKKWDKWLKTNGDAIMKRMTG